jgi:hypothetical protein
MDDHVALRPGREDDLPMLEALTHEPEKTGEFGWFGWVDPRRWRRNWDENRLLSDDGGTLPPYRSAYLTGAGTSLLPCAGGLVGGRSGPGRVQGAQGSQVGDFTPWSGRESRSRGRGLA